MGQIFDRFGKLAHRNEAEVSQNFLLPLLTDFLGYETAEILPERTYPARDLYSGVTLLKGKSKGLSHRPDYIVILGSDIENVRFIVDSKEPHEDCDAHIGQIVSYANSVGCNLLVITNGREFCINDANNVLLKTTSVEDLDIRFEAVRAILSKESHLNRSIKEIYADAYASSITVTDSDELTKRRVRLSDFQKYLVNVIDQTSTWHTGDLFGNWPELIRAVEPHEIVRIKRYGSQDDETYSIDHLLRQKSAVVVGETGAGKSTLLRFLAHLHAHRVQDAASELIPIPIDLRDFAENKALINLIAENLHTRGFIPPREILPASARFFLLLDGFDECPHGLRATLAREIQQFARRPNIHLLISTREIDLQLLDGFSRFAFAPLSDGVKGAVFRSELGTDASFHMQGLLTISFWEEIHTILELAVVIFLLKHGKQQFRSRADLLREIVDHVGRAYANNAQLHVTSWPVLVEAHATLAIEIVKHGTVISRDEFTKISEGLLSRFKSEGKIGAVDARIFEKELVQIGFLAIGSDEVHFRLRSLLHYFAAFALLKSSKGLASLLRLEQGGDVLTYVAGLKEDATHIVVLLEGNLWLASTALSESRSCESSAKARIISRLKEALTSSVLDIRHTAMGRLLRLRDALDQDDLIKLFSDSPHPDVRAAALSQLAQSKSSKAKELVLANLNWKENFGVIGHGSPSTLIAALSNFGKEEFNLIFEIWNNNPDISTSFSARDTLSMLHDRGLLAREHLQRLVSMYEGELAARIGNRLFDLERLMIKINSPTFTDPLIDLIAKDPTNSSHWHTTRILAKIYDPTLVGKVISRLKDSSATDEEKVHLSSILAESVNVVALNMLKELLVTSTGSVRRNIVKGLGRFDCTVVGTLLESELSGSDVAKAGAVAEALIKNHGLPQYLDRFRGRPLFDSTIEAIITYIGEHSILEHREFIGRARGAFAEIDQFPDRVFFASLRAEGMLGFTLSKEAISQVVHNDQLNVSAYQAKQLLAIIHLFDSDTKEWIVETIEKSKLVKDSILEDEWFDALEHIRKVGPIQTELMRYISDGEDDFRIERRLRAMLSIGSVADEALILQVLHSEKTKSPFAVKRALECLIVFGSKTSLRTIKGVYHRHGGESASEYIKNACIHGFEAIVQRHGYRGSIGDEDLKVGFLPTVRSFWKYGFIY